jgi:hypothetical protein
MFGTFNNDNAFTVTGLVNGDTIGGFSIFNPGGLVDAKVEGSPYPVVFSNPTTGTYVATNYQTVYVSGKLTVLPWPISAFNAKVVWPNAYTLEVKPNIATILNVEDDLLLPPALEE